MSGRVQGHIVRKKKPQIRNHIAKFPQLDLHMTDYIKERRKNKVSVDFKAVKEEAKRWLGDPTSRRHEVVEEEQEKDKDSHESGHSHSTETMRDLRTRHSTLLI